MCGRAWAHALRIIGLCPRTTAKTSNSIAFVRDCIKTHAEAHGDELVQPDPVASDDDDAEEETSCAAAAFAPTGKKRVIKTTAAKGKGKTPALAKHASAPASVQPAYNNADAIKAAQARMAALPSVLPVAATAPVPLPLHAAATVPVPAAAAPAAPTIPGPVPEQSTINTVMADAILTAYAAVSFVHPMGGGETTYGGSIGTPLFFRVIP